MDFDGRVEELFLDLPEVPKDAAFAHISRCGKLIYVGGQLPYGEGRLLFKGRVGLELSSDAGKAAARAAAIQALGVIKGTLGTLNEIKRLVHVRLYIATGAEFKDHRKVLAGSMELLKDVFGTFADCSTEVVGCASLPEGAAVELAMVIEVK